MRSTNWLVTHNNPKCDPKEYLEKWSTLCKYVNGQLEKGAEGTVHIQAYLSLKKDLRMSTLKKHDPHAHFEPVKFDNGASAYCLKEDTRVEGPWEFGKKPVLRQSKKDWQDIWEKAKEGKIEDIPADVRIRCYTGLKRIEKDHMKVSGEAPDCKGIWVCGPSGAGKSRFARDNYPDAYKKLANKWWDGYQGEKYALLEDLDPNHACLGYHLKIWADRYHAPGETKGGQVPLTFDKIIVTSQYRPEEVFTDR